VTTAPPRRADNGQTAIETLFKMVYEQSRSFLCTLDLEGRILHANRVYTKVLGFPVDDLLGRSHFQLVHADDQDAAREAFRRVLDGETLRDFEVRFVDREGQPVHVLGSGTLIRDGAGRPIAISTIAIDTTETRRLAEELRALETHHNEIVESADVLFVGFDVDGRITSWNRASETLSGVHRTSAIGKSFYALMARPEDRATLRARASAALAGERAGECECALPATRGELSRGESSWSESSQGESSRGEPPRVSWDFTLRRDPAGLVVGLVGIGRDTTESRRAQRETMRVRETLENILQSLAEGLFVVGADGETTYWNRRMEEITGLAWADVVNRKTDEAFPWLFETGFAQTRDDLLRGRLDAYESPPRTIDTPGGRASVVLRAMPYRSADGQIAGTIVRLQDVTESLRLRADLVHSEARYKNLVESATDCIHVLDLTGRFLEINSAGLRICDIEDPATILGKRYDQIVNPESSAAVLRAVERARAGEPVEYECATTRPDGRTLQWSCILTPVRDARGHVRSLLGISRDITDRKRLDDELQTKNERLAQALEELRRVATLKDEFLSSVSHELRTPLTSIRSYTEILLDYPDEDPSLRREFLGIVQRECRRLTTLLNDVLDLSKIESGEMPWRVESHEAGEFIGPAVDVSRALAIPAQVAIDVAIEESLPAVSIDKDRFLQVVLNLMSNAIRHSPRGGTVRVEAGRTADAAATSAAPSAPGDATLFVRVRDQGPGIAPEDLDLLFDKYFQTKTIAARKDGTGLGLAISREIVSAFGGKIWAESQLGKGSTFTFTIPLAAAGVPSAADRSTRD